MLDSASDASADVGPLLRAGRALPLVFERVGFTAGGTRVLTEVSLTLAPGAPTFVLGPNGAGKTTLLKLAAGLHAPTTGAIRYAGLAKAPKGALAIMFQKPVMLRRSAAANIAYALWAAGRSATVADITRLLELANIAPLSNRPARRLSGGEQQRLALVRALARDPEVLLLDEPTASLDPAATRLVEDIIRRIAASGVKIVMTTHDLGQARRLAGEAILFAGGRLVEQTAADRFFSGPSSEAARRFLTGELLG
ncbi:MAG TPA: ATP-binding cassette domain-containing protein [Hyphomicrobiaceae bacterium]|nr:ATP-binding cassette domain-containing protein [Hyphomicrobiaceae bacterium]